MPSNPTMMKRWCGWAGRGVSEEARKSTADRSATEAPILVADLDVSAMERRRELMAEV